jgi:ParB-like chromosome segregation protein Spo0J
MTEIIQMTGRREAIKFHPLANIFPLLEGDEFDELVASIKANGQREPIAFFEGMILDGRNRYRACIEAGIEPSGLEFTGTFEDAAKFVIDLNLRRRHLNTSQRAMAADRLANIKRGDNVGNQWDARIQAGQTSQDEAAEQLNVSRFSVQRARAVSDHGSPELIAAVERGVASVSAAADITELPKEIQSKIAALGEKEILRAAKEIRSRKASAHPLQRILPLILTGGVGHSKYFALTAFAQPLAVNDLPAIPIQFCHCYSLAKQPIRACVRSIPMKL